MQEKGDPLENENCQILRLNNERFTVPEILLHPSNIGMECMGLAEAIVKSIKSCPKKYQSSLSNNILFIGGNTKFLGFKNRIFSEIRSLIPYHWKLNVTLPKK